MWKSIVPIALIGGASYAVLRHYSGAKCRCKTRLDGLNIIITGANSGIGKALAYELAERGATLILACRNVKAALDTKIEIINSRKARSTGQIHIKHLDLNSIESILKFSDGIKTEFDDIYALVNNAGVFHHPRELTVDKFDVTIQTNYLGPFILTHLLLPNLRSSEHARIVNISSNAHYLATEHDLKALLQCQTQDRSHILSYAASKLAVVLFSKQLNKNLSRSNIIVNTVDPGNVETNIFRYFPQLSNPWSYALQWPIRKVVVKSPKQGCQSILHLLLTPNQTKDQYIVECKPQLPSKIALQDNIAQSLYDLTLHYIQLSKNGPVVFSRW